MDYKTAIKTALATIESAGTPVSFMRYTGTKRTYITFFCYNEMCEDYAENEEISNTYNVQVDVWSNGDADTLVTQTKAALQAAGFTGFSMQDLYEKETETYHKAISMNIKSSI